VIVDDVPEWLQADALRIRESKVKVPSDMLAFGDATLSWTPAGLLRLLYGIKTSKDGFDGWGLLDINTRNLEERPAFGGSKGVIQATLKRHRGRYNVVFCDGHAETIPRAKLFAEQDTTLRRWNNDNLPHEDLLLPH
jgi:prepilin-type processing-associated H-X9-DG protein